MADIATILLIHDITMTMVPYWGEAGIIAIRFTKKHFHKQFVVDSLGGTNVEFEYLVKHALNEFIKELDEKLNNKIEVSF